MEKFLLSALIVLPAVFCEAIAAVSPSSVDQNSKETLTQLVCRSDLVMNSIRDSASNRVLIAAHRGAHNSVPENSLVSIDKAIDIGADIIELDIRLTADGIPILMHDKTVDRTTNGQGLISKKTLKEVKQLRLLFDGKPTEYQIPTLSEVLLRSEDRLVVNLDLKVKEISAILKVVEEANAFNYTMFFNNKLSLLSELRNAHPNAVIMPLAANDKESRFIAENFDIEIIHLKEKFISRGLSNFLDKNNSAGWANSLGRVDTFIEGGSVTAIDHIINAGVDIIQTDRPKELLAILETQNLRPNYIGLSRASPCGLVTVKR
jgi:glycerophosphoryl diester phosphodiesterase